MKKVVLARDTQAAGSGNGQDFHGYVWCDKVACYCQPTTTSVLLCYLQRDIGTYECAWVGINIFIGMPIGPDLMECVRNQW